MLIHPAQHSQEKALGWRGAGPAMGAPQPPLTEMHCHSSHNRMAFHRSALLPSVQSSVHHMFFLSFHTTLGGCANTHLRCAAEEAKS